METCWRSYPKRAGWYLVQPLSLAGVVLSQISDQNKAEGPMLPIAQSFKPNGALRHTNNKRIAAAMVPQDTPGTL